MKGPNYFFEGSLLLLLVQLSMNNRLIFTGHADPLRRKVMGQHSRVFQTLSVYGFLCDRMRWKFETSQHIFAGGSDSGSHPSATNGGIVDCSG